MYPILTPKEMTLSEKRAYSEGYTEEQFMENAGVGVADLVHSYVRSHQLGNRILLLCGKGNNGGDAYVAGRCLILKGYDVTAIQVGDAQEFSPLLAKKQQDFIKHLGIVTDPDKIEPEFYYPYDLILDGLFGTGFHGEVGYPFNKLIQESNNSGLPIIAVDVPSGLNGATGEVHGPAIHATVTAFLAAAKSGFFLQEGWNHVGELQKVDFGLPPKYIQTDFHLLEIDEIRSLLPQVMRNRHKYQAGYVVGLAGSLTMPGAAMMSSLSVLRSGAGMMRLLYPEGMENVLTTSAYEIIKTPYKIQDVIQTAELLNKGTSAFIGPGMGTGPSNEEFLKSFLSKIQIPVVFDADALTLLSKMKVSYPQQTILTPHVGEMSRLLGYEKTHKCDDQFIEQVRAYAQQNQVVIVLKGGPTFLFSPKGEIIVSPYGNPGMATAGSGDVLTGIIAAQLAQKLSCWDAAKLGVVLHGLAGDMAVKDKTVYGLIATDIIAALPAAYEQLL